MNLLGRLREMLHRTDKIVAQERAKTIARERRLAPILNANKRLLDDFHEMEKEIKGH